jgi:hypothetical protein
MSRGKQKVSFGGLLQENVLGTFKIIRGFRGHAVSGPGQRVPRSDENH